MEYKKNGINPGKYSYLLQKDPKINNTLSPFKSKTNINTKNTIINNIVNLNKNEVELLNNNTITHNSLFNISNKIKPICNFVLDLDKYTQLEDIDIDIDINTKPYTSEQIIYFNSYLHKNINNIINVYNLTYKANVLTTGFGDFIRGCYFLLQFCEEQDFNYGVVINHPIHSFLKHFKNTPKLSENISKNVPLFRKNNFNCYIGDENIIQSRPNFTINDDFTFFLKKQNIFNHKMFIHTNAFPNNIINEKHRAIIKNMLTPIDSLEQLVDDTLILLTLSKQNYEIIHIRLGDTVLTQNDSHLDIKQLQEILNYLNYFDNNIKCLLISDNEYIKKIIVWKYPFIKTLNYQITHTGENLVIDEDKLRNTMLEFYLMSHSSNIVAYSVYGHGSGFSKWCAETYNIPYVCKYLPE